jgi:hypothetical protein
MKKISMILMAFALAVTMSQCKKNEEKPTSNDEVVTITLDVAKNNGSKVVVNPSTGTVDFETGDKIYVGSGGKYVGFLTHNGTNFSGNITNPTENQPLQFYFLGNVTPTETLAAGTTEECSVIISDQTEHLPVISCAASYENYVSGVTAYSAYLLNKCALVKFNVTTPSNSPICITGMKNKVMVDFSQNTVTPSMDGEGVIKLPAGSGENVEKWAILLPQEALEEGEEGSVYSEDGNYVGIRGQIPPIEENGYLGLGISMIVNTYCGVPIGAINSLFSVSDTKQVCFSQGNLQYQAETNTFRFAPHQYNYVGIDNSNIYDINYLGWIDLFGWGTSGWDNGNVYYHPNDYLSTGTESNGFGYGPIMNDLTDEFSNADWGVYNAITNGGNQTNQWRTLTFDEWVYLSSGRQNAEQKKGMSTIVNVKGIVLLPDAWVAPEGISFVNATDYNYYENVYSLSEWRLMEEAGAVFLPCAGSREGTNVNNCGIHGHYWSSTALIGMNQSFTMYIAPSGSGFVHNLVGNYVRRDIGLSVRLVKDYNP